MNECALKFSMVFTLALLGCGVNSPSKIIGGEEQPPTDRPVVTDGTWGHLIGGKSNWLAQSAPGQTVGVCGDYASELVSGIRNWLASAKREGGLAVLETCDRAKAQKIIGVYGRERPEAVRACAAFPKAVALTYVAQGIVVVCESSDKMSEVMLHEAGHLWGMCDVYPENIVGTGNCDERYYTGRSRASVMGANYALGLTDSDRLGLAKMVERSDVSGNLNWKGFNPAVKGEKIFDEKTSAADSSTKVNWSEIADPSGFEDSPITCEIKPYL